MVNKTAVTRTIRPNANRYPEDREIKVEFRIFSEIIILVADDKTDVQYILRLQKRNAFFRWSGEGFQNLTRSSSRVMIIPP
jgi:hypothetical protein